jgi:ribosomal protein S18 acetylase RimI-like enzyme
VTTTRAVRPDDAAGLLALQHVHQQHVLGRPDTTADDVADSLADPDLVPGSQVVEDDDGSLLGCALVFPEGSAGRADVEVVVDPVRGAHLLPELLASVRALAAAAGREHGLAQVDVDQGCYRQDEQLAAALDAAGFARATTFHRMRRELDEPVEVRVPPGVVVTRVDDPSDDVLRRAYRLHASTFAGHFGFVERPWEEWLAGLRAKSGTGPLWFATLDGADVGFLHETAQFVEDEDAGYVWRLGVEQVARGRGVAKALLLTSFAAMRDRGRRAALLHVDGANATGATALYESVGMRPAVVIDVWRAAVSTAP